MLQGWVLFGVSALYVALLFGIAWVGDRRADTHGAPARKPWTYSLALGVYCTSWTFYGAVGRAATSGWDFLPIYLGPMLVFVFGWKLIGRIVAISKRHNITSIADFIGARYGRHQKLAMLVTFIAVFGVLPYIALQLKAVAFSFEVLSGASGPLPGADNALLIALLLAAFAILFGTRQVVSSENHHGMMLAIAFESVCKLLAFLAVGLFVVYGLFDGFGDAYRAALALPQVAQTVTQPAWQSGFLTQTLLAAAAILCLPRQFHVTVVENTAASDLRAARWIFPLYLLAISLFVLPITAAGLRDPGLSGAAADTYVLAIPLAQQQPWLALAAYLGGFSAATSMVIVASIALSTMLCNEIVMPLLLRWRRLHLDRRQDLSGLLKSIRRIAILGIIMLAYLYYRLFTGPGTLTSIGLLSFAAVAQFAPSLVGGVYWKRATYEGAIAGLLIGFVLWCYTLLLPALASAAPDAAGLLRDGPLAIAWLRPQALFGLTVLDPLTHGVLWSLGGNILGYLVFSLLATPGLRERLHATRFLEEAAEHAPLPRLPPKSSATVGDLQTLLERFFGADRARALISDYALRRRREPPSPHDRADPELARHTEHLLAGALGTSSARLVLASTLRGRDMQLEDVILLLDETSHAIQFNRELLRATLEHLSQGVSVVDSELKLVAWNRRYVELFHYPNELIEVGRSIEDLVRYNADRGLLGEGATDAQVARRLEHMRAGHAYTHQRELPDGSVIEIRGKPMPGGGFVTSYSDVTDYKRSERSLQDENETLESRVALRTGELQEAKAEAERANEAKTRFLAAASHDLVQPLNAARLFLSSMDRRALPDAPALLIGQVETSLLAAETLLSGLLDISRLDARAQELRREHFEVSQLLEPLASEFHALAQEHGLKFTLVPCRQVVESDPRLLRRVLQNFLSNAIRYTRSGRIVLGCRRERGRLRIEVWDSGPGIAEEQQREIFEEFRRLNLQDTRGERGLGLGLAIAERIARLLEHPLTLRSWPGRGSVFAVSVPLGRRAAIAPAAAEPPRQASAPLAGLRVLCLENEPAVLAGMQALLGGWGCEVIVARDADAARQHWSRQQQIPDLLLVDYHLDDGVNGVQVAEALRELYGQPVPGIVITADHTQAARAEAAAHDYSLLPKPVKPAALRALMSRLLSQREDA